MALQTEDDYAQDDLTATIDTGHGGVWILGAEIFPIVLIVVLLFGRFVVLRKVILPAAIWNWDRGHPYRSIIWSTVYGVIAGMLAVSIALAARSFPWALPSLIVGLYVTLSSRAALLNNRQSFARDDYSCNA
jgi:hypothetical protein